MPLPSRAGEPDFKLKIDPSDKLVFKYKMNENSEIPMIITNVIKDRIIFKIKCTDNELFRVSPPLGLLNKGEQEKVRITLRPRDEMDQTKHYLAIYYAVFNDLKETNPRKAWKVDTKIEGVIRIQAQMDTDEKVETKKEEKKEVKKEVKNEDKKEENKEEKKDEEKKDEGKKDKQK